MGVVPPGVVTEILTVQAACTGEVATSWVEDLTVNDLAGVAPKVTLLAVSNPVPVMVTWVPPDTGPLVREREEMVGTGFPLGVRSMVSSSLRGTPPPALQA